MTKSLEKEIEKLAKLSQSPYLVDNIDDFQSRLGKEGSEELGELDDRKKGRAEFLTSLFLELFRSWALEEIKGLDSSDDTVAFQRGEESMRGRVIDIFNKKIEDASNEKS